MIRRLLALGPIFALVLGLVLASATPLLAAGSAQPGWLQTKAAQCKNASAIETTCSTSAFGTIGAGDTLIITAQLSNSGAAFTFSGCTYNGSSVPSTYDSGQITVAGTASIEVFIGKVTAVSGAFTATCTTSAGINEIDLSITEVTLGSSVTVQHATCSTSGCNTSLAHSLLAAGDLAVGVASAPGAYNNDINCGTGWTEIASSVCYGTDRSANTLNQGTAIGGYGNVIAFADVAGSSASTRFQQVGCSANTTPALTVAPTNGNIVAGAEGTGTSLASATFKDSNAVSYTLETSDFEGSPGVASAIWDKAASGSPTAAGYVFNTSGGSTIGCVYEMVGVSLPAAYNSCIGTQPISCVIAGVKTGDLLTCIAIATVDSFTITTTNGSFTQDVASGTADGNGAHGVATATASTTFATTGGSLGATISCADYPAPVVAVPSKAVYPGIFQPAFVPYHDRVFELLAA